MGAFCDVTEKTGWSGRSSSRSRFLTKAHTAPTITTFPEIQPRRPLMAKKKFKPDAFKGLLMLFGGGSAAIAFVVFLVLFLFALAERN